jgi:4-amino-4-deoxy-L-arabinose transferase
MENLIFGIAAVIICSTGYFAAWRYQRSGNFRWALLILVACGVILRVYISSDLVLHQWDERYHALVARNLIIHPFRPTLYEHPLLPYDLQNWAGNHIWLHKQPLPLWGMAISMRIFGVNEIALRIPSILLSSLGIWLTYAIGSYLSDRRTGFLAAFLFSINGLILELTGGRVATDHIDIFFLFFIQLAIFFSIRYVRSKRSINNLLVGVALGAAILTKWLTALIVLPVWLLIVTGSGAFSTKRVILQLILVVATCTALFLPWQLYIFSKFPAEAAWESGYNFRHLTEVVEERSGSPWYYINRIRINYGEVIYLPLLWFLWKTARDLKNLNRLAVTAWFLIPFIFYSFAKTKMQGYLVITSPALFLMTSEFYYMLKDLNKKGVLKWISVVVMALLLLLPVRYSLERLKPFQKSERNPQWSRELRELGREGYENVVMFNYPNYIEAMFYTGYTVYSQVPDQSVISELISEGHTVIINHSEVVSPGIAGIEGIIKVNLAERP